MSQKLLTIPETAQRLGLKEKTVRRWVFLHKLTYVKVGSAVRIPDGEVERIIREGTVPRLPNLAWVPLDAIQAVEVRAGGGS